MRRTERQRVVSLAAFAATGALLGYAFFSGTPVPRPLTAAAFAVFGGLSVAVMAPRGLLRPLALIGVLALSAWASSEALRQASLPPPTPLADVVNRTVAVYTPLLERAAFFLTRAVAQEVGLLILVVGIVTVLFDLVFLVLLAVLLVPVIAAHAAAVWLWGWGAYAGVAAAAIGGPAVVLLGAFVLADRLLLRRLLR
jgi:hypothetical protein